MPRARSPVPGEDEDANRATASLLSLVLILVLLIVGLLLVHVLHRQASLEDCMMAGRLTCQPLGQ
jgi:hypothetical protein